MERRKLSREFKLEAVKLVRERGVAVAQAARDLDLHVNVLRKWVREQSADPQQAFPGHGQMKPEQLEIEKLRCEVAKLKAERDSQKSRGLLRQGLDMRFSLVAKHRVSGRSRGSARRSVSLPQASMPGSTVRRAAGSV